MKKLLATFAFCATLLVCIQAQQPALVFSSSMLKLQNRKFTPASMRFAAPNRGEKLPNQCFTPFLNVPYSYHYEELAFFCRLEVQLEKRAKFPVKFRLGDVQYVDRLEGKID